MKSAMLGAFAIALIVGSTAVAQPLVTDGLSVYYSFDELADLNLTIPDESGNGLDGEIWEANAHDALGDGLADISLDTEDFVRGTGSIWFNTELGLNDDYIAIAGCSPVQGCEVSADLIPSTGFTVAAWLNPTPLEEGQVAGDMSIYQTRSAVGSFTHTQLQADGRFRMQLRGQVQSTSIIDARHYTDGTTDNPDAAYPRGEWFHWAGTYDATSDMWAMYYNGAEIGSGFTNTFGEPIGDWGQGALLGLVPDIARQLVGKMDEFYVFTRALSAEEIETLANPPIDEGIPGDYNGNGTVEQADLDLVLLNWGQPGTPGGWTNDLPEGNIDQAELDGVLLNWGNTAAALGTASVPEPAAWIIALFAGLGATSMRRLAKGVRSSLS
jgi:hypothetical protein